MCVCPAWQLCRDFCAEWLPRWVPVTAVGNTGRQGRFTETHSGSSPHTRVPLWKFGALVLEPVCGSPCGPKGVSLGGEHALTQVSGAPRGLATSVTWTGHRKRGITLALKAVFSLCLQPLVGKQFAIYIFSERNKSPRYYDTVDHGEFWHPYMMLDNIKTKWEFAISWKHFYWRLNGLRDWRELVLEAYSVIIRRLHYLPIHFTPVCVFFSWQKSYTCSE